MTRCRNLAATAAIALAVTAAAALLDGAYAGPEEVARSVTISRDAFGVPHIEGPTDASVEFGLAYAQAEDNFPHLEDNFIRALGRSAEVHGENVLLDDEMVAALEIPRLAESEYRAAPQRMRALYDAYAAGLNFYVAHHPEEDRALLDHFEPWFPLALLRYKYHLLEFVGYAGLDEGDYRPAEARPSEPPQGSNAWAIAPSRSASGAAMLLINPHVGFFGPAQYYEAHLISGEGWNFSDVGRYGFPFPYMGHSDVLGWAHTDNYRDIGDLYVEHFDDPVRPLAYRYGRGWRMATETGHDIRVRTGAILETRHFSVRRTHHGPIVSQSVQGPLAIRLSRLSEGGWFQQWYEMSRARNFDQFRRALDRGAIPYMNIVYADRDGKIFYAYNGAVPRRRAGFDFLHPVDGSDPRTEWMGYHRFREMPQVLNPTSGFVQNTNSSPFFTSASDNPSERDFPTYMIGPETLNPRAQASHAILDNGRNFSFEDWTRAATDTHVVEAERLIPELSNAFAAYSAAEPETARRIAPLIQELADWDRRGSEHSVAMTLFVRWYLRMRTEDMPESPARRFALLDEVRSTLIQARGDWRVAWGEINRLQRTHWDGTEPFNDDAASLPVLGGPGWVGIIFNFYTQPPLPSGRAYGRMGNSYVSVVEFGRAQTRARSIVYFGQSGRPGSPHYFDQAPLYAEGQFKPAPTTLEEVRAAAAVSYHPGEED